MRVAIIAAGVIAFLVLLIVAIGYALPVHHRASRTAFVAAYPDSVYDIITTPAEFPRWRRGLKRVEILPSEDGRPRFREDGADGSITYVVERAERPSRVVSRIADKSLPFGGTWTYELTPASGGTTLRITEEGEVYNPVFRFMARFVFGHHRTMDHYLADLGARVAPLR